MDLKLLPSLVTLGGNPLQDGGGFVCRRGMMGVDQCVGIGDAEIYKEQAPEETKTISIQAPC